MKQDCPTYLKSTSKSKAIASTLSDTKLEADSDESDQDGIVSAFTSIVESPEEVVDLIDEEEKMIESKFKKMDDQDDIHTAYTKLYKVSKKHDKLYKLATRNLSEELEYKELSTKVDEANQTIRALCWYCILSALDLCVGSQKIQKYYFLSMGPWEHPKRHGETRSDTRAPKVPLLAKMTKMPIVNLGLTEGQTRSKSLQNNIFHGFTSNLSSSEVFSKFDQAWPLVDF